MKRKKRIQKIITKNRIIHYGIKGNPTVNFVGQNGNIFNLLNIAKLALEKHDLDSAEMIERVTHAGSYQEAFNTIFQFVEAA